MKEQFEMYHWDSQESVGLIVSGEQRQHLQKQQLKAGYFGEEGGWVYFQPAEVDPDRPSLQGVIEQVLATVPKPPTEIEINKQYFDSLREKGRLLLDRAQTAESIGEFMDTFDHIIRINRIQLGLIPQIYRIKQA